MELTHRFSVPTAVEETWAHFQDIGKVAECFPGAQVTKDDGTTFEGTVKVKLGPIALVYAGHGTFVDKDDAAHRFVVDAKGKDKRGNGTAGATVTLAMDAGASGGTDVEVVTYLSITGKPAQFGRGVMQDVSDKLLNQFVACLEQELAGPATDSDAGAEEASAAPPVEPSVTAAPPPPGQPTLASVDEPSVAAGPQSVAGPGAEDGAALADPAPAPAAAGAGPTARTGQHDAIDLGSTVLPVLVRSYWRQGLAALLVLIVLRRLLGRR